MIIVILHQLIISFIYFIFSEDCFRRMRDVCITAHCWMEKMLLLWVHFLYTFFHVPSSHAGIGLYL